MKKAQNASNFGLVAGICTVLSLLLTMSALANETKAFTGHRPEIVSRLQAVDRLPATMNLSLAIGLSFRNQAALDQLLKDLNDPSSPRYQHFLKPAEFAAMFGPTEADYQKVKDFAKAKGLKVTRTYSNRALLDVTGTVADIEKAFHVTMRIYQHPTEGRKFYAPDRDATIDAGVPAVDVTGLDNYLLPHPVNSTKTSLQEITTYTGSGPQGGYIGNDFRTAYAPGVNLTGVGQYIGLFSSELYYTNDLTTYQTLAGRQSSVVTNIIPNGDTAIALATNAPWSDDTEVMLDMGQAMSMAPGATIVVFVCNNNYNDIWNAMATQTNPNGNGQPMCMQLSSSFTYGAVSANLPVIFQQIAAQGQVAFIASGDAGAFLPGNPNGNDPAPEDYSQITTVGGTLLTMTGTGGAYQSETAWSGSGGGFTTNSLIPSFQQGMNLTAIGGSTTYKNLPDVAAVAAGVVTVAFNGVVQQSGGTSASSPTWAGYMALVNQQRAANGLTNGFNFNATLYQIGRSNANYTTLFHDITTGNNTNTGSPTLYWATNGYDLVTGWGSPNGSNLINYLSLPTDNFQITPGTGFSCTTSAGVPFSATNVVFVLTNVGGSSLNWTLGNTSAWLNVSSSNGTLNALTSTTLTVSLNTTSSVTNIPVGTTYYMTVFFTNTSSGYVQSRLFSATKLAGSPVKRAVGNGNWDTTTLNWAPLAGGGATNYTENSLAAFDDSASGSSPITVTLAGNRSPTVVTNNSSKNYILAGNFPIISGSLVKDGSGTLVIDNGGVNGFSSILINNGTVQIGNSDTNGTLGTSAVTNNGTLVFNLTSSLTVHNQISGTGQLNQNGSGTVTLATMNAYSGNTAINAGTLTLADSAFGLGGISNSAMVSIAAGATFDLSGWTTYVLTSKLSASGTGTNVGSTAAVLKGSTSVSLGTNPVVLVFTPTGFNGDTNHPPLLVSQGALAITNSAITVSNISVTALGTGVYRLIRTVGGMLNGPSNSTITVTGSGIVSGTVASLSVNSGNLNLVVTNGVPAVLTTQFLPPNAFVINVGSLVVGRNYVLQSSTNLVSGGWVAETNFFATQPVAAFTNSATATQKFYRFAEY